MPRPRKNPDRLARSPSGPSGRARRREGEELHRQRRAMVEDFTRGMDAEAPATVRALALILEELDVTTNRLPIGAPGVLGPRLGLTADEVGKMWRGERRYPPHVRIL